MSTMASLISLPEEVNVSKIEFGAVKLLDSGGKMVNIRYEGRNLTLETPSLAVPYGVNVFDKTPGAPVKYSVDLSLRGVEDNADVQAFQTFLEAFDERLIDAGVENAQKWFKMANPSREVIKAFYTPSLKYSRDATGALKPYPPTVKLALRKVKGSDAFEPKFYDCTKGGDEMPEYAKATPLETILAKRTQATATMQCTGIWFAGGKFGTTWKATQIRVESQPETIRGPTFRRDAPDIRAFVSKGLAASSAAAAEAEDEDDEECEETVLSETTIKPKNSVLDAVLPPPKAAAATASAPTSAFSEAVSEAVAVPKKVVKKVVSGVKKA